MIIFYYKATGKILGVIHGRIHSPEHLKMWQGDPAETERIIIQWKPVRWYNKDGAEVKEGAEDAHRAYYEPESDQDGEIIADLEKHITAFNNYKIDLETQKIIPNG